MSARANYFKIGVFVSSAIILALIAIVYLGAGALFREKIMMETYIDESVQGLEIGSAVRYRGVKIGSVEQIDFVHNIYGEFKELETRYVVVQVGIFPEAFPNWRRADIEDVQKLQEIVQGEIERGLRVRLASQGMATGMLYLEADYLKPEDNPPMATDWTPEFLYIPSAKSTITTYLESVDLILKKLEKTQIEAVADEFKKFLETLTAEVENTHFGELSKGGIELIADLQDSNKRLQEILNNSKIDQMIADAAGTLEGSRSIVENSGKDVGEIMGTLKDATQTINNLAQQVDEFVNSPELAKGLEDLGQTSASANAIFADSSSSLALFNRTVKRLDNLILRQQMNIDTILKNLTVISENIKELSEQAKKYPSGVLFGGPPTKKTEKKKWH